MPEIGEDTTSAQVTYQFAGFEYAVGAYELRRNGRRIRLARQPMDLLGLLLERRGQLVTREDISARLWGQRVFVDRDAGTRTAILKIRQVLNDTGASPRFIETVPGKGYRFIATVAIVEQTQPIPVVPQAAMDGRRHNLPADLTRFVGRTEQLNELRQLLASTRLLTLTGPGGVGKTRLATRFAADRVNACSGGVWFIDLTPLSSADLIVQAIGTLIGVRESPGRSLRDAVVDYVRARDVLLVFDTCEHLLDDSAQVAESLLRAAPSLTILATSREPLRLPGETLYGVGPLSLPRSAEECTPEQLAACEATVLFVERAAASRSGFQVADDAEAIARICHRLDGIPLAIELAAAQVAQLSLPEIDARLSGGVALPGTRTSIARQRTLDATVEWSHQLLSAQEQVLFNRLAVFPSSWNAAAVEQVCGGDGLERKETLDLLANLVSKSLVTVDDDDRGSLRYRYLETIRHYARERRVECGAADRLPDRHFAFVHEQFRDGIYALTGSDQVAWLKRIELEQDNVRAALDWGLASPRLGEHAVELAGSLFWYWTKRGLFAEGRQWLERAASIPASPVLRGRVALGLGHMDYFQGRLEAMSARNDATLALGREAGDSWLTSRALFGHALAAFERGACDEAARLAVAARDAARPEDFRAPLLVLGNLALISGEPDRAMALFDDAIDGQRRNGEIWGLGIILALAAGLRIERGDTDKARAHASEALAIYQELEDPRGIAWSLDVFAGLFAAEGHAEDAARLWGVSDTLLAHVGGTLVPTIGWIRNRYKEPAAAALGTDAFARAGAAGRAMSVEDAIAIVSRRSTLQLVKSPTGNTRLPVAR